MCSRTIVCDLGTSSLKLGYAGADTPQCVIPTVAGIPHNENNEITCNNKFHFGNQALDPKMVSSRLYPMENGTVCDWAVMEDVILYGLTCLHETTPSEDFNECRILVTEPSLNPIDNKKKVFEYMFESLKFGAVNMTNQSLLVLYARGLLSGMVVECGEGITQIVPISEGIAPHHLIKRHGVTGKVITSYLRKLLQLQGFHAKLAGDFEILRKIKNTLCYASCNLEGDRRLARETTALVETFTLPDGSEIKVGQERFEATEAYFDPSLVDLEDRGLSDLIFDTIQESSIDCRLNLYKHIVLSGGSSMFGGMPQRLQQDIRKRYFDDILKGDNGRIRKIRIDVEASKKRNYSVFLGGSILADLMKNQEDFWVTKFEYEEVGIERLLSGLSM